MSKKDEVMDMMCPLRDSAGQLEGIYHAGGYSAFSYFYLIAKENLGKKEGKERSLQFEQKGGRGHRERASILSQHCLGFFSSCEIHSVEFPKDVERSSVKQLSPKLR